MQDDFTVGFFAGNRARLRERAGLSAPIVLTGNGWLQRNGDVTFKFRQDSSFWYLTGIAEPDIILVMDADEEYLILPGRDLVREAFDGVVTPEMLTQRSGVERVYDEVEGWKRLGKRLKRAKEFATFEAHPAYIDFHGFYSNPSRSMLASKVHEHNPSIGLVDIRAHAMWLRARKQDCELAAIRKAVDVTVDTLAMLFERDRLRSYAYEYEIEADLTREFRRAQCDHAFDPIVSSGARACQLHNMANNGKLGSDELLVMDVGAEYGMYAADVARTVALGTPSKRQQEVFDAVCAVQDFALAMLKPGTVNVDYEKEVERFMGDKLMELGVTRQNDRETVRRYFPHATTHFLGLDAHDVGDYRAPMEAGMAMVCEPGIYIPEEGIGVRIEDSLVITDTGHDVLSAKLPRALL